MNCDLSRQNLILLFDDNFQYAILTFGCYLVLVCRIRQIETTEEGTPYTLNTLVAVLVFLVIKLALATDG